MKSRYLPLAGMLIIGTLGASGSTAAATINHSISDASIAEIAPIAEMNEIETIGYSAGEDAIEGAIGTKAIDSILIKKSEISSTSRIAIENIIDDDVQANLIDAGITGIAA